MAASVGTAVNFKIGNAASPELFNNVVARAVSCTINGSLVDITDNESTGWRQALDGGGIRSLSVSLQGAFKAGTPEVLLRTKAATGAVFNAEMKLEGSIKFSGAWQCTSYQTGGEVNGAQTYSATVESAGIMTGPA